MIYRVFDNGKRAQYPNCKVHFSWDRSEFTSFQEASDYAHKWLGGYAPKSGTIKLNEPYDYSGHGDYILIDVIVNWDEIFSQAERIKATVASLSRNKKQNVLNTCLDAIDKLARLIDYGPTNEERNIVVAALTNIDVRNILIISGHKESVIDSLLNKISAR